MAARLLNGHHGWGVPARLFHWALAALLLFLIGLGFWMARGPVEVFEQLRLTQMHKSWGAVAFGLAGARLAWRWINPKGPALPSHMPPFEKRLARLGHVGLYLLMFAIPLTGWLMASASPLQDTFGIQNKVFDWFALPDPFVPGSEALRDVFHLMHLGCTVVLIALILGHVGAALRHQFILKDGLMRRM